MDINFFLKRKNIFHNIPSIELGNENDNDSEIENPSIIHSNKILDNLSYKEMDLEDSDFNLSFFNRLHRNIENGNKPTNSSTNKQTQKNLFIVQKEEIETPKIKREPIPPIFSIDEINNKIKLYIMGSKLKSKLLLPKETNSKDIELIKEELEAESFRGRKKLKININLTEKYSRGRKKMEDNSYRSHNQNITDNIICKLINKLNNSLLGFINGIINKLKTKEEINKILIELNLPSKINKHHNSIEVIKKNDYKFRMHFKKIDKFIEFLNFSLKDYFSLKISPKFKDTRYSRKHNELILNRLLNDESKNNNNNKLFDFILNKLKISDYIELFLHQKDFEDLDTLDKNNLLDINQKQIIENNLKRIEKYFDNEDKIDINNFHCFALVVYNLKRLLFIKEIRKSRENNSKI